jgi:hypothetical protein
MNEVFPLEKAEEAYRRTMSGAVRCRRWELGKQY